MRFRTLLTCSGLLLGGLLLAGLPAAAQTSGQTTSELVQPAIVTLTQSLRQLHIDKWKAPGPVKDDANRNAQSIERDLETTLPGLISTADQGGQAAPAGRFAVYRNLDALYDVLLRVSLTAELAAPDPEIGALNQALENLESARKALGDSITGAIVQQQQTVAQLQAAAARAAAAPPPPPAKTNVVDDGPAAVKASAKPARKKKPATPPQPQQ